VAQNKIEHRFSLGVAVAFFHKRVLDHTKAYKSLDGILRRRLGQQIVCV